MKSKNYLLSVVMFFLCYCSMSAQVPVPFTQRVPGGTKIQGDIVFVGNHITNTAPANNPSAANNPYNGTSNNNGLNFEYIDIDGDATTFSSSSADLNITSACKKIVYAGLYWTATYPFTRSGPNGDGTSSNYNGSPRNNTWNQVKFKVPGGAYVSLTADAAADPVGQEDDIIFDGYNAANPNQSFYGAPYVCYKNVTSLLQALANANGTYTIADQRAATGIRPDGISSGWSIVVIYQDPNLPSKYISMFDGYANIDAGVNAQVDFNINGFLTVPAPQPVRARIGVSTLEGDYNITGDNFRIKANSVGGFTTITNGLNPNNNFFNGSVTINNVASTNRNPASSNTLGFDLDIVGVNNPLNAVIPNGETGATLRATTNGDSYGVYLTTFDVEIIEPKIVLTKVVQDATGADIGNGNVNLCQDLNYVIGYQNIGNDDATNFTIKDILPINITFNPATDLVLPAGVTYTYSPLPAGTGGTLIFTIPNNQVNIGDPRQEIRIKVKVVCTCIDLDDACSNIIKNQAFASYGGNINNTFVLTDDPSLSTYSACNLSSPSSTNFLVGLDACDFTRDVVLCGTSVVLTAANGYQSYVWHDALGNVIGNTQSITVTQIGTYTVNDNINTSPCKSIIETIHVIDFVLAGGLSNPVIPYADQVVICPNDNKPLPLIFLCGASDSQLIQTNIAGATSIVWQQLNTASCAAVVNPNCANENPACTWTTLSTGPNFTATAAGQYKVIINFPNGCFRVFYFNVFQNLLAPTYVSKDVICTTQGSITVNSVPAGYEYSISSNPGVWQLSNVFSPLPAGVYTISIRQIGVAGGCVFTIPNIAIRAHNFTVTTILTQPICTGNKGSINIAANDVNPQYTFSIYQEPGHVLVNSVGPINPSNYVFTNLNPGNYSYQVTTQDGCNGTGLFTITTPPLLTVTAAITKPLSCTDGEITVYPVGGTPLYNYIVTGAVSVTQSSPVIAAPVAGTYNIQIVDSNNCTANTSITLVATLAPVFTITHTDINCSNSGNTGSISINVTNPNGNTLMYSVSGAGGPFSNSSVFTNLSPGTYNVVVQYTTGTSVCTTAPQAVTIAIPTAITGIATLTTPYTCTTNGVITVSGVSGGTPGYTYSINGGVTYQAGTTFTITGPGTYTITIKDSKGCTFATNSIVVAPLNPPTDLSFTATALTCPSNTSNVTLTATGGDPILNYQIVLPLVSATAYGPSNVFNNLAPGTYTFQVRDGKNCTYQESFTINPLPVLTVTGTVVSNVKCFGSSTGSVSYTVTGSTGFTYTINAGAPIAGTSPITLVNQPAGTYTIVVTNTATNCTATATVTIAGPASALAAPVTTSPITCLVNGQATVNATGGWGGYTYSMAPMPVGVTQSGNVFSNIPAGAYVITTTDSGGCAITTNFSLTAPVPPTATISAASDFCYDSVNGATIVVTAAGGVAPYQYSYNGNPYQASNTFPNLTPGTYTITVIDSFGCTVTLPVQTINPQLTLNTVLTKDLDCTASPSAVITGTIGFGYPPYTYQVSVNAGAYLPVAGTPVVGSTFTYTAAAAGTYQFLVTDSKGCTVTSGITTINPLIPVAATHVKLDNKCFGDASGTVTITPSGGVGPYQINFNGLGFSSTTTYTNLAAGTYNYIVRDSKSCTFNGSVTITQPTQITYTAVVNPITCNPLGGPYILGSICVNGLAGGTAPYTYTLVDLTGGTPNQTHVEPAGANYCFPNIDFGIYDVIVTDANGCTIVKSNLIMSNPPSDLTFVIAGSVPSCAAGATVTVTLVGAIGAGPFEFGIVNLSAFPWSSTFVPASNPPFTHIFTGLTPGAIYTIVVRDITTGCYYFEQMPAPTATNSTMNVTSLIPNNVTCRGAANGSVTFSLSGINGSTTSISYVINFASNNQPVGTPGSSGTLIAPFVFPATIGGNLPPGTYNIQFVELGPGLSSGCGITSAPFTITESAVALTLTATTTNDNCNVNAGHIAPVASGGTGPYLYQYLPSPSATPSATLPGLWTATNPFNGESGTYDVYVRDAFGCIVKTTVTINLDPTPVVAATVANACAAQGAFVINVTLPTAGVGPYTYSVDAGAYQAQTAPFTISGLSSGAHTVQVRDVNGCGNLVNVNILAPLVVSASFTTMPTCLNNNGTITAVASGGSGNYTYTLLTGGAVVIAGPQASPVFPNQPAGSYIIRVTDTTTGCSANTPFNIPLPTAVTYTAATTPVSCIGLSNGTITINLSAGNNNPPYTYQILAPIVVGPQASNIFTGLPAQTYTVQVNSGSGCFLVNNNVVVGAPTAVVATTTATPFGCAANNSVNTSTVTITGAGGTPAYTYSIDGVNYFPTNTFTVSNTGGVQNITGYVKDLNGCIDTDVFVLAPLPALVSATVNQTTAITCNNPELITITVVGGSGNFTYQALPTGAPNVTQIGATNQFNISAPGTYFFQVNDVTTGCYIATLPYTVAPFNTINVVAAATIPVTCFGGNNGELTINVTGYTGAYSYSVLDNTNTSVLAGVGNTAVNPLTIIGLAGGNYTVQVTETASPFCVKVSNVITIAAPSAALIVDAVETANVTCSNDKGVITATATGGWGTYTYSIAPVAGVQTGNVFSSLPAGNYTITVTDLLTCSATDNVILVLPAPINSVIAASAPSVACFGDETASITISYPTGGQGSNYSYIFSTSNPTSQSGPISIPLGGVVIPGLGADTYTITISDGYGCSYGPINIVITEPTKVNASLVVATTQTCLNNTTLTLTGSGGTQPYTYSTNAAGPFVPFVPAASTTTTITVPVGTYSYYIQDANGCLSNVSNGITIDPLTPLAFTTLTNTNILCGGSNSGTITAIANGGLSNYVYTLLDGAGIPIAPAPTQLTPGNFTNLAAGTYQVRVTSLDCTLTSPNIIITAPTPLVIVPQPHDALCKGDNSGSIDLVITGGTPAIQYSISPNLSQFFTIPTGATYPATGTTYNIPGLSAGTYTVIVQDQNGCTPMPPLSITVGEPPVALSAAITGFTDETCAEFNNGTLTIGNITGGTAPYSVSYSVIYPDNTVVVGPVIALPLGTTTYTFTNLNGGIYTALITDANGCKFDQEKVIGSGVLYDPYAQVTFPCESNLPAVRVEVVNLSNPPSLAFNPMADYLFALDVPANTQLSNIFTSAAYPSLLVPGNHIIYVTNLNNCDKQTQQFTINAADVNPLTLTLTLGGLNTILATSTGGSGGNTYTFNGYNNGSNNTYVYQQSGFYTVIVTDSSGCSAMAYKYFEFIPIFIPNVFTPNGDSHNPMWGPTNTGNYKDLVTKVYDRYGRVVAELAEGQFWDGKYNNQELPSGDYWYVIKVDGNNDSEYVGHFTLYR